tara:strand:- start:7 stop:1416 length:1410 start_codon:yes stop_codon:yes gene_type:complete
LISTHKYLNLGDKFTSLVNPNFPENLTLELINTDLASQIGLNNDDLKNIQDFCCKEKNKDLKPFASAYAGHQFGQYVNQLGDGRGLLIGQSFAKDKVFDLFLKGSGITPFSRFGDGRAILKSSIREYIGAEAMHGLRIPTSRSLMFFSSSEKVQRDQFETAAMIIRTSKSHIRFGNFEYFYYKNDSENLKKLIDYCFDTYSEFTECDGSIKKLFSKIVDSTASMIASWQALGFCHGVMNTDNFNIFGETFDYGPFAFLEDYNPNFICNLSDTSGRYSYANQPYIGLWNCSALGQAFSNFLSQSEIENTLKYYEKIFSKKLLINFKNKLGLTSSEEGDPNLIQAFLDILHKKNLDFTKSFRDLENVIKKESPTSKDEELRQWQISFLKRHDKDSISLNKKIRIISSSNPIITPKNFQIDKVNMQAEEGDFSTMEKMLDAYKDPFIKNDLTSEFSLPPKNDEKNKRLSCAS